VDGVGKGGRILNAQEAQDVSNRKGRSGLANKSVPAV
jgi:hypothetical protein